MTSIVVIFLFLITSIFSFSLWKQCRFNAIDFKKRNINTIQYFIVNNIDSNDLRTEKVSNKKSKNVDFVIKYATFNELQTVAKLRMHVFYPQNIAITSFQNRLIDKLRNRVDQGSICLVAKSTAMENIFSYPQYMYFGNLLGTVEVSPNDFVNTPMENVGSARKLYVADLAIREDVRRQGIASKLLHEIELYAMNSHYPEIYLHVETNNTLAKSLYLNRGYCVVPLDDNVKAFTEMRLQNSSSYFMLLRKIINL